MNPKIGSVIVRIFFIALMILGCEPQPDQRDKRTQGSSYGGGASSEKTSSPKEGDSTADFSLQEVQAICEKSCLTCHGQALTPPDLSQLANFQVLDAVNTVVQGTMPKNGGLTEEEKNLLIAWRDAGYPLNEAPSASAEAPPAGGSEGPEANVEFEDSTPPEGVDGGEEGTEEQAEDQVEPQGLGFAKDIEPILESYGCSNCHATQAPLLTTKEEVLGAFQASYDAMANQSMPPAGDPVSQENLDKFKKWQEMGGNP